MRCVALVLCVAACTPDQGLTYQKDDPTVVESGAIAGRVCDPSGRTWLQNANAYVNLVDEHGVIYDTVETFSDETGTWTISDLPGEAQYTVYVTYGNEILIEETVWVGSGETVQLDEPSCFDPLDLEVAVVTGDYDDFDDVLDDLGFLEYTLIDGLDTVQLTDFLSSPTELAKYDVIFFNGGFTEDGIIYDSEDETNTLPDTVIENVVAYVDAGGSIYASDWAYDIVEIGWPDRIEFVGADDVPDDAQKGDYCQVDAAVSDASLAAYLETQYIPIEYDLEVWPPIENVDRSVSTHLTGSVEYTDGLSNFTLASVPLLVSFNSGDGKVAFSTFRVARNADEEIVKTVQYMMYNL